MKTHKDLNVWQESIALVTAIYQRTATFPKHELYGLTNQIRRAAVSISTNISEGSGRQNSKEFRHFLRISLGSLNEFETLLFISMNLEYIDTVEHEYFQVKVRLITSQLCGLIRSMSQKIQTDSVLK